MVVFLLAIIAVWVLIDILANAVFGGLIVGSGLLKAWRWMTSPDNKAGHVILSLLIVAIFTAVIIVSVCGGNHSAPASPTADANAPAPSTADNMPVSANKFTDDERTYGDRMQQNCARISTAITNLSEIASNPVDKYDEYGNAAGFDDDWSSDLRDACKELHAAAFEGYHIPIPPRFAQLGQQYKEAMNDLDYVANNIASAAVTADIGEIQACTRHMSRANDTLESIASKLKAEIGS